MSPLHFEVVGIPAPQGSKKHVGRGVMVESSKKVAPWRDSVTLAARTAHQGPAFDGPLHITIEFRFPPTSSWRAADRARGWRWKDRTPDLDKLCRSTFDALTAAGVVVDDARFTQVHASKREVIGWSGAVITVLELANEATS